MKFLPAFALAVFASSPVAALTQAAPDLTQAAAYPYYSRLNSFGVFAAYSNDSSHILLGQVEDRKLLSIGGSYNRRLWQGRVVNWQYSAELIPVALESDPIDHRTEVYTSPFQVTFVNSYAPAGACRPDSGSFTQTIDGITTSFTYADTCSRQWTIGEAMSPVGFQWNFMPARKLQPFLAGHGGYMYSTQANPVVGAGSFNFTFDFGAGVEFYRTRRQSIRAEYRYHHISNHETAAENPGIDNWLLQVTYVFGR